MSNNKEEPTVKNAASSPWWGIAALFSAWTGLIGFILGILATMKGLKKKSANTLNTVLGIMAIFISIGAMLFQLLFGVALIFGSSEDDLGNLVLNNSSIRSLSYSMNMPEKFEQDKIEDDGDRYIYRANDSDVVRAVLITSCSTNVFTSDLSAQDTVNFLENYLKELPNNEEAINDFSDSFGGVKNLSVGAPVMLNQGRYASKGYAVTLFADHPYSSEPMYGEMHMMTVNNDLCAGAWLATDKVHEKNELKMDEALNSLKIN